MLRKFAVILLLGATLAVVGVTLGWSVPVTAGPTCEACD